jgi:hypothetical protein
MEPQLFAACGARETRKIVDGSDIFEGSRLGPEPGRGFSISTANFHEFINYEFHRFINHPSTQPR